MGGGLGRDGLDGCRQRVGGVPVVLCLCGALHAGVFGARIGLRERLGSSCVGPLVQCYGDLGGVVSAVGVIAGYSLSSYTVFGCTVSETAIIPAQCWGMSSS